MKTDLNQAQLLEERKTLESWEAELNDWADHLKELDQKLAEKEDLLNLREYNLKLKQFSTTALIQLRTDAMYLMVEGAENQDAGLMAQASKEANTIDKILEERLEAFLAN